MEVAILLCILIVTMGIVITYQDMKIRDLERKCLSLGTLAREKFQNRLKRVLKSCDKGVNHED